jgi:hypothetical protein
MFWNCYVINAYLMKRTTLCLLLLTGCNLLAPPPAPPTEVTLSASSLAGTAPLEVTFTAQADPASDHFRWTVSGQTLTETGGTLRYTFGRSGLYVVSAAARDGAASVTVSVDSAPGGDPGTGPSPTELSLTPSPGGPAPWAVAYTVEPAADPEGLRARCSERAAYQRVVEGRFACLHEPGDRAEVRYVDAAGEVTARASAVPEVVENDGVAFAGRWRYRARGTSETFTLSEGTPRAGRSADGRFRLFTIVQNGLTVAELTIAGQTVVLEPVPGADGRQRFVDRVYGLELEQLEAAPD